MTRRAFFEDKKPEQGNSSDPFYAIGSVTSIGETEGSFSRSLFNKEQIKLSFNVAAKTSMLPNSSSIYYFNVASGSWNIPSKSLSDHVGPFGNVSVRSYSDSYGSTFIEDAIGFDHRGSAVVSGNLPILRNSPSGRAQKIEDGESFATAFIPRDSYGEYMTRDFPKSIQRNQDYNASSLETFTLPISYPFLIEKVVFEIPFCFGNGWFYDKASLNFATSSVPDFTKNGVSPPGEGYENALIIDQGGPGISLSLFSQKNYGAGTIRDLICHSLITHEEDLNREVKLMPLLSGGFSSNSYNFLYWILGINGMPAEDVDFIVTPSIAGSNKFFTGSIQAKSTSKISNGLSAFLIDVGASAASSDLLKFIERMLSLEYIKSAATTLASIDSFGRGMTGFAPSGGSIFGGEYTVDQTILSGDGLTKNEFYISDSAARSAVIAALTPYVNHTPNSMISLAHAYYKSNKVSPYLVYPGEKLVLATSKTRPAFKNLKIDINTIANQDAQIKGIGTLLSSSYINSIPCTPSMNGHDVQFNTGTINIIFYGSYVKAGDSYIP